MRLSLMMKTTIYSVIFSLAALGVMFYVMLHKEIVIEHVGQDEVSIQQEQGDTAAAAAAESGYMEQYNQADGVLAFEIGKASTNHLCIPLPVNMKAENVAIENYYMDREMHVILTGSYKDFYSDSVISGQKENITNGFYMEENDTTRLIFTLNGIFEYKSILEDGNLYIEFLASGEVYDKIVVIDPAFGATVSGYRTDGLLEKDLTLAIAQKVKQRLDDTDIKVYYTRMDDNNPTQEQRIGLANEIKADVYIRIEADYHEDAKIYGTTVVYNESFFIPGFGSVELANLLEYEVVSAISGKALGMVAAAEEDYTIKNATVPAATIKAGYLSNPQEVILLKKEDYRERIAEGIYQTILKVYENYLEK